MNLCEYGCGNEANFQLKNGKYCCLSHFMKCPAVKEKRTGENNPFFRKTHTTEIKNKISESNKGKSPWNKNKVNCYSKETLQKMKINSKGKGCGKIPWNKNKKMSEEFCEKRRDYMKGRKNPAWKGGYSSNDIPLYDTYVDKLTVDEVPERDKYDKNILTVLCSKCGERFIPKLKSVIERVRCLNGTQKGEMRLYCSDRCKHECSIYWKQPSSYLNDSNEVWYTQEEYKIFREYVLKRDNYICQYCGRLAKYVHHERPQKLEPFFSLDPDLAWSVCKKCHYEKGHKDDCSTGNLASKICSK